MYIVIILYTSYNVNSLSAITLSSSFVGSKQLGVTPIHTIVTCCDRDPIYYTT